MPFKDKRGNLRNIELFKPLAFCHSESAGRRCAPYLARQILQLIVNCFAVEPKKGSAEQ